MPLHIATCQFPTSDQIIANRDFVLALMERAKAGGADVAHFPEACLSGYAGNDMESNDKIDWALLASALRKIMAMAATLKLWIVLGTAYRLTPPNKPHNSLYFIDDRGQVVDRYDKRFLSGGNTGTNGDLAHYTPGNHFAIVDIKGVRCGALICVDCRYPELYRAYKQRGVDLMFHSFNAAHVGERQWAAIEALVGPENHNLNPATTYPGITQPAMIHAAAGSNHMWISCPNSSAARSCWPSFFMRPDGVVTGRLSPHETGILLSVVDIEAQYYDSTEAWRTRAMKGILHSGDLVADPRSDDRKSL